MTWIAIAIGGALGSLARHGVNQLVHTRWLTTRFPVGTVAVNVAGCFIIGLLWICTYYVFTGQHLDKIPVFNDLGQFNLLIGIGFMAVGFSYATRWE